MRREMGEVTSLVYSRGHREQTNRNIMSDKVVWCDVHVLAAGEEM